MRMFLNKETPTFHLAGRANTVNAPLAIAATKANREKIRLLCAAWAADGAAGEDRAESQSLHRRISSLIDLPGDAGQWLDFMIHNAIWERSLVGVPVARRMLLLPKPSGGASAKSSATATTATNLSADLEPTSKPSAVVTRNAGELPMWDRFFVKIQSIARDKGLAIESISDSGSVIGHIVRNGTDALIGVGPPADLLPIVRQSALAGIPCLVVPISEIDGNVTIDEDWILEVLDLPFSPETDVEHRSYVPLMRAAARLFDDEFPRLCPASCVEGDWPALQPRENPFETNPITATERVAFDFLRRGGKQSRPFMLLAVYDALTGGQRTLKGRGTEMRAIPDSVKRTAMAIETFHKASLVHDDIQDEDDYRYGLPAIHRQYGVPLGINIGDYLIGLGYRLVSRDREQLGGEVAAELLDHLADAHQRLCAGQGAELAWRDCRTKRISVDDALQIYALKTAPAFEVAMIGGACLAGQSKAHAETFRSFAYHLGVAFQILNDLKDWKSDPRNKKTIGGDLLNGRPTVLWALALDRLPGSDADRLLEIARDSQTSQTDRLRRAKQFYHQANVFALADDLVSQFQRKAADIAESIELADLRHLMRYIVGSVLARHDPNGGVVTESRPQAAATSG